MRSLETIVERQPQGQSLIPPALAEMYGGNLVFTNSPLNRPFTMVNFVTTLEGLTSFSEPGHAGGGDISMFNPQDTFIMGLLRALSDGVAVGANTLRLEPQHLWTSGYISPENESLYQELRSLCGKKKNPVSIFVTGSGKVLPEGPVPAAFQTSDVETLIVTTEQGKAAALHEFSSRNVPEPDVITIGTSGEVDIPTMMYRLRHERGIEILLIEGGSRFNGAVTESGLYDEIFITRSPQVIGTSKEHPRPTFAEGFARSAGNGITHNLVSIKIAGDHIFERWKRAN